MVVGSVSNRIVLSLLLVVLTIGCAWMGIWALRGRETHMPGAGAMDLNPSLDPDAPPLHGKAARWAGIGFVLIALVFFGTMVGLWR